MKRKIIFLLCLLFMIPFTTADAQSKKTVKKKKPKTAVLDENPRFTAMLESTAMVTVVDSAVVDSFQFLDVVYANKEEGHVTTYELFFKKEGDGIVYVNELGNKCIYSKKDADSGHKLLYQSDLLADGWTEGEPLEGVEGNYGLTDFDTPYLMPDGVTLYFSAKGGEGLGGYDIYRTRLDSEKGKFLKPENLGLPFNSEQDDFMYLIDEQNKLAYFVSNRHQPSGKVCVYTFIPFDSRTTVSAPEEKLRSLARLNRIADTWGNRSERDAALRRKQAASNAVNAERAKKNETTFSFVINDQTTYTKLSDFRVPANRNRIKELQNVQKKLATLEENLKKKRLNFSRASSVERQKLQKEIIQDEQQATVYYKQIRLMEKTIRNAENQ